MQIKMQKIAQVSDFFYIRGQKLSKLKIFLFYQSKTSKIFPKNKFPC